MSSGGTLAGSQRELVHGDEDLGVTMRVWMEKAREHVLRLRAGVSPVGWVALRLRNKWDPGASRGTEGMLITCGKLVNPR